MWPRALRRYWSRHLRSGRAGRYEPNPRGMTTEGRNDSRILYSCTAQAWFRNRCRLSVFTLLAPACLRLVEGRHALLLFPQSRRAFLALAGPIRTGVGPLDHARRNLNRQGYLRRRPNQLGRLVLVRQTKFVGDRRFASREALEIARDEFDLAQT